MAVRAVYPAGVQSPEGLVPVVERLAPYGRALVTVPVVVVLVAAAMVYLASLAAVWLVLAAVAVVPVTVTTLLVVDRLRRR